MHSPLTGCSDSKDKSSNSSEESTAKKATDSLVVYAGITDTLVNGLIPEFEANSGVKVEVITGSTSELHKEFNQKKTITCLFYQYYCQYRDNDLRNCESHDCLRI